MRVWKELQRNSIIRKAANKSNDVKLALLYTKALHWMSHPLMLNNEWATKCVHGYLPTYRYNIENLGGVHWKYMGCPILSIFNAPWRVRMNISLGTRKVFNRPSNVSISIVSLQRFTNHFRWLDRSNSYIILRISDGCSENIWDVPSSLFSMHHGWYTWIWIWVTWKYEIDL